MMIEDNYVTPQLGFMGLDSVANRKKNENKIEIGQEIYTWSFDPILLFFFL